jgi:Glycosyltransferase family 87
MNRKFGIIVVAFAASIFVSVLLSYKIYNSDFPVYYFVASTILDPQASPGDVYRYPEDTENKYSIPERKDVRDRFLYSLLAAYLMAPLGWLPYYTAKSVMIFVNIAAYLCAVVVILKLGKVSDRWVIRGAGISCLWLPFLSTLMGGQINGLLLLFVAGAVLAATRGHPYLCGALFALSALFKLFPLAIALVLGLRNRRILIGFTVFFGASFLIPGATEWISRIINFLKEDVKLPAYVLLETMHPLLVLIIPILIAGMTALVTVLSKSTDYPMLTSFAIPAALLSMPRLGYYHLTVLVFSYCYLFSLEEFRTWPLGGFLLISALVLGFPRPGPVVFSFFDPVTIPMSFTLFCLWVILGTKISLRSFAPGN